MECRNKMAPYYPLGGGIAGCSVEFNGLQKTVEKRLDCGRAVDTLDEACAPIQIMAH